MARTKKAKTEKTSNVETTNSTSIKDEVTSEVAATEEKATKVAVDESTQVENKELDTNNKSVDENKDKVAENKEEKVADEKVEDKATEKAQDSKEQTAKKADNAAKEKKVLDTVDDEDKPVNDPFSARIIVITSGKGGVGKTTTAAAISTGLALRGHKTAVIDFDVGLRNLDLIMGCERRVVYDFISVLHGEATLRQALIKDRHTDNLYILAASQTKDKEALSLHGVGMVLKELSDSGFEYIICDSPAGIETGALMALYYADEAIVTTNPEISSVRDSDRIIGILNAKSRRAVNNLEEVKSRLLLTRYAPNRVSKGEMLSYEDINELLTIPLLGIIPESPDVLKASNKGDPIILNQDSNAGKAYSDAVERILGKDVPLRFIDEQKGFFQKLFGK